MPTLCNSTNEKTTHPTQKPLELSRKFILASSNEGDLVIDPFGGSGTTYVICEQYNRRWYGCEIDEDYCSIIKERLQNPEQFASNRATMNAEKLMKRREKLRNEEDRHSEEETVETNVFYFMRETNELIHQACQQIQSLNDFFQLGQDCLPVVLEVTEFLFCEWLQISALCYPFFAGKLSLLATYQ